MSEKAKSLGDQDSYKRRWLPLTLVSTYLWDEECILLNMSSGNFTV